MHKHRISFVSKTSTDALTKKIAAKLNQNPNNRCPNVTSCLSQVKGGSHVYIDVSLFILIKIKSHLDKEINFFCLNQAI